MDLVILIEQDLQLPKFAIGSGLGHWRNKVIDNYSGAATLGLGPFAGIVNDVGIDIGQIPRAISERLRNAPRTAEGDDADPEIAKLRRETWIKLIRERALIIEFLDEFYRDRNMPYEKRLILNCHENARLMSQGVDVQDLYSPDLQREKLNEFREEMGAFTGFLKTKFFSTR